MKLFLDENMPLQCVEAFETKGFEVEHVRLSGLIVASDKEIAMYAKKKNAVIVTKDLDFGNILNYPSGSHYGLIIIRFPSFFKKEDIIKNMILFFDSINKKELIGKMHIVEVGLYRSKAL